MLTAQDDLIGHQTPAPFATSGAGDARFTERYWYTAHPIDGSELLFDAGLGELFVVRNVDHDHEPGSTVKAQPSLLALGNMVNAVKRVEEDVQAGGKKKHYENAPN